MKKKTTGGSKLFGKTYIKIIVRRILQNFGRFVAIFGIVALGVGFLAGLLSTSPDMKASVNKYFSTTNMMDIFIKSNVGLTDGDVEQLKKNPDVDLVQSAYVTDAIIEDNEQKSFVARIYGLPLQNNDDSSFVNKLELLEGRFAQNKNECLAVEGSETFAYIKLGTKFVISNESATYFSSFNSLDEVYNVKEWTVTGIVRSPLYISGSREPSSIGSGGLNTAIYIYDECYALPSYTDFYVTLKNQNKYSGFTDAYQNYIDSVRVDIEKLGKERINLYMDDILLAARKQANVQIAKAEFEISNAQKEVIDGRQKLDIEKKNILSELNSNQKKIEDGEAQLADSKRQLIDGKKRLDEAAPLVENARSNPVLKAVNQAKIDEYDAGLAEYNKAVKMISEKEMEIKQGHIQLEEGKQKAETEFSKSEIELSEAEEKINGSRITLNEEKKKMSDGKIDLSFEPKWYVLDRNSNVGSMYFRTNVEKFDAIAKVFPLFFLLLSILVVLTTMTRLVEEERMDIGTLKALGYRKRVILLKYIVYCVLTGILGSAAGIAIGFQSLPRIFYSVFKTTYHLPPIVIELNWKVGIISSAMIVFCISAAAIYSCYHTLWENPAKLMHPRAPKTGKRIFLEHIPFLWSNMKFTYKVTARNLIRQKKHFFMTITGIAGCTALMVTGFGLHDSIVDIARTHFKNIYKYDLKINLQPYTKSSKVVEMLEKNEITKNDITFINSQSGYIISDTSRTAIELITSEQDITAAIELRDPYKRKSINFNENSVVLTQKIAEQLKLKAGDVFILQNSDDKQGRFILSGITENYVGVFCYLGNEAYKNAFDSEPEYKTIYVKTDISNEADQNKLSAIIFANNGIMGIEWTSQTQSVYTNLMNSITSVVFVLIVAAGILAVIVLYNLTNINIEERKREISTLRVLGFHQMEVATYILREIMVLSVIGALCGLLLGIPLHRFVISVAETADLMFGRQISLASFVFSFAITMLFSGIVDLLELPKIRKINMATSMKSVE